MEKSLLVRQRKVPLEPNDDFVADEELQDSNPAFRQENENGFVLAPELLEDLKRPSICYHDSYSNCLIVVVCSMCGFQLELTLCR